MIDISKLSIGQKVHYKPVYFKEDEFENGLVKEIPEHGLDTVRVVYNCGGDWKTYKDYTGVLTYARDLQLGWNFKTEKNIELWKK